MRTSSPDHRLAGEEVYFLTGVDQHGQKVHQAAEKEGISPAEYVKTVTAGFSALWKKIGVEYDGWAETTDSRHIACVQAILSDLYAKDQIYRKVYKGHYSVRQEQFLTDRDHNEAGEFGAEWGEVTELEEQNYYFKLSDHTPWLRDFLEKSDDTILPAFRKSGLINALEKNIGIDLCISRPKERLTWGIELPFDENFVTSVWFDALINYISLVGFTPDPTLPDFGSIWTGRPVHIIDKDKAMDNYEISIALEALNRHVVHCNQYAEKMKPWELNKNLENKDRLATVLHHLAESVAHCAVLLSPVLPDASAKLAEQVKLPKLNDLKLDDLRWGLITDGHTIENPSPVFPRIEVKAVK